MRQHLRVALPPLATLSAASRVAFVVVGQDGRLVRAGELPLPELAAVAGHMSGHAILHPDDAIVTQLHVPPVAASRLDAVVAGSVEPLVLSGLEDLCIAHSPRGADGRVTVAWAGRRALQRAWGCLADAGVHIVALVPHALAIPADDPDPQLVLGLPAGPRWFAPLPAWSLALDDLRPTRGLIRWRRPMTWAFGAVLIWLLGLNGYAAQLDGRVQALQASMRQAVAQAFPAIPVIIDPLRQAIQQRDAARLAQGVTADDDFMPLALATARVLGFAKAHVQAMHYQGGELTLTLSEGFVPPANEAALDQAAAVQRIVVARDPARPLVWQARRPAVLSGKDQPS